ncbi:D-alanyl-D-alanine carboxypeptidase [Streptomyces sp. MMS24-I2-30]|uniref:D-alanyl-D-alanine carboxypeptidase n=1 Tax=Streptomyces sp. MMS24-I2-30 TaxID=3351564 RepID=UPI003896D21E
MKEASVAGESPDRSKQRESSAEQTSGSGGAVPEARDPRVAVARESGSRGGVDTATKVLSVREAPADGERDGGKAGENENRSEAADGGPETDGTGEVRLRAAVAAWVRPGDSADAAGTESAEGPSRPLPGATEPEAEGSARIPAPSRPAAAPQASTASEEETEAPEAEADAGPEADAVRGASNEADATADGGEGGDEDADRDGADSDAGPDAGREGAAANSEAVAGSEADSGPEAGSSRADAPQAPSTGDDERRTAGAGDARGEADAKDGAEAAEAGKAAEDDAGPARGGAGQDTGNGATAARAGAAGAQDGEKTAGDGEKTAEDGGSTAGDGAKAAEDGAEAAKTAEAAEDSGNTPGGDGKAAGDGGKASAAGKDQPTAVFKAVRASGEKPQVDQPTTTLKVGGAKKPAASESDSERTSTFVALKPLDDPAAHKPRPSPAEATSQVPRFGPERTAQQPLPPKPPLDLLAELTNTPPPPQTPVRTIIRRVKIWTPLVLLLAVVFAVVQAVRPLPSPRLDLTAQQTYTFDGGKASLPWPSAGEGALDVQGIGTFGSSGTQRPVPIASVAKVMTAYLILRDHPLKGSGDGPNIHVDQTAEDQATADGESTVQVRAGDSITEREALEGVLIASANNVARLLARWDAGSEKAFVAKMNAAAKDLGMTQTTYTDPSGLEKTTVSTAVDQVKLAKAAMQDPAFREVAQMMEYTDYKGATHSNWNRLVGSNGVVGIKTGTTTAAGGNLVFAATKEVGGETKTIVGAVLGQGPGGSDNTILSGALDAGDKLIRAAQDALRTATILKKGDVVGYVDDGLGGRTPVVSTKDVPAVGWAGLQVRLSFSADAVPHSAKAGTTVGTLTVGDGSSGAVKVPVALQQDLTEPGFTDKLTRIS